MKQPNSIWYWRW